MRHETGGHGPRSAPAGNQDGTVVCTFERTILVQRRGHALEDKANY